MPWDCALATRRRVGRQGCFYEAFFEGSFIVSLPVPRGWKAWNAEGVAGGLAALLDWEVKVHSLGMANIQAINSVGP